ncbi:hypothetical protein GC194_02740 [bacterium]|nr:hypothetical protein [bacterium]
MKQNLLLIALVASLGFLASCGGGDDPNNNTGNNNTGNNNNNNTGNNNTGIDVKTVDEVVAMMAGDGKDSVVWIGQHYYEAKWDASKLAYSSKEEDMTDDPNIQFTKYKMWLKYEKENSVKFGYPVGHGKMYDPHGKSGINFELHTGELDKVYVNPTDPGETLWYDLKIGPKYLEYKREWAAGGNKVQQRYVWVLQE